MAACKVSNSIAICLHNTLQWAENPLCSESRYTPGWKSIYSYLSSWWFKQGLCMQGSFTPVQCYS